MVIAQTPLRLSIVGGGTDLPVWYKEHGAVFVSAAIDKYIYTTYHESKYNPNIRLRYSKMEEVSCVNNLQNEIARETLKLCGVRNGVEITSHAEIPSGTGLGSSGAFGVGLLHAINPNWGKYGLTNWATMIQVECLNYPIGLQDQIAVSFGGLNIYTVDTDGTYSIVPLQADIEDKLVMFYTGIKRDTNTVLKQSTTDGLEKIQELAHCFIKNPNDYGEILKEHWEWKKKRGGMSNPQIDEWYELGLKNGAIGGKIIGAGGGGFLLFYTHDREKLIESMPLQHQPFKFDYEGSKIIYENLS